MSSSRVAIVLLGTLLMARTNGLMAEVPSTQPAAGIGAEAGMGAGKVEIPVTVQVYALDKKSPNPVKQLDLTVKLTDAAPPDRPLRELDPYGPMFRIEYHWKVDSDDRSFWYFIAKRGNKTYQVTYGGQVVCPYEADNDQAALDAALKWLEGEVAAQYSQLSRKLAQEGERK